MDASVSTTARRTQIAVCVVALWLAWTVPAWMALNRGTVDATAEADLLATLAAHRALPNGAAVLIASPATPCACQDTATLATAAAAAGLAIIPLPAHLALPYPAVVFNDARRLVYAGGATLDRTCLGGDRPAWPLIVRLLQHSDGRALLAAPCSC